MSKQVSGLFMEKIDEQAWLVDVDGQPELICVYGPYMNQRIVKEVYGELPKDQIVLHATPTTHHDAHWDHPGKHMRTSLNDVKRAMNLDGEIKDDCALIIESNLKLRQETNGYLISQNNSAYFVNNEGARLLKLIGNKVHVGDIRKICDEQGISERAGMEFLRRLVTFGLYKAS